MADLEQYFRDPGWLKTTNPAVYNAIDRLNKNIFFEGAVIHEIAHGVFRRVLKDYVARGTGGFWRDKRTQSGTNGAEQPATAYGATNASEDLSEAVRYYFTAPQLLAAIAPLRYDFINNIVNSWWNHA